MVAHHVTATYKGEHVFVSKFGIGNMLNLSLDPTPLADHDQADAVLALALADESLTDQTLTTEGA